MVSDVEETKTPDHVMAIRLTELTAGLVEASAHHQPCLARGSIEVRRVSDDRQLTGAEAACD
jgi:hypothetical protein